MRVDDEAGPFSGVNLTLYDRTGHRKYLTTEERDAFLSTAESAPREVRTFCAVLAYTGCRISEALALTADRVDLQDTVIIFETLKKRRSGIYRAVPVPDALLQILDLAHGEWAFSYFRVSHNRTNDPFMALSQALTPLYLPDADKTDRLVQTRKLGAALRDGELPVADVVDDIRRHRPTVRVLLIADQFEELYTSNIEPRVQTRFIDLLLEAAAIATGPAPATAPGFSLLLTLRADFLGATLLHRPLADAIGDGAHILGPMDAAELKEAIVEPARLRGVAFEPGLVDTILADVGEAPGNLPLLEFALTRMWAEQRDATLSLAAYEKVGRITGALTAHEDQVFLQLEAAEQATARRIFTQGLARAGQP